MSQHNYSQKPSITELSLIEVSTAIGSITSSNATFTSEFANYLDLNNTPLSEITSFELVDLLNRYRNELNKKPPRKLTSSFRVFNKSKQLIAENVSFTQAKQYQNCIVKFLGMVA